MKILFASHNKDKQEEVKKILRDVDIVTLSDLNDNDEVVEDGKTLKENAFLKANYYHRKYDMPVISDDTGLFVNALNGRPGVYSSRYSGENATYVTNNMKLLSELEGINDRSAYFECVVCFIDKNSQVKYFVGKVDGEIVDNKQNIGKGFGYDSVFYVNMYKKTYYELTNEVKNKISHRYLALNDFANYLREKSWLEMVEFYANNILDHHDAKVENRLLGGMSNYTYVVSSDDELYTIRFPGEYAENFVNREQEARNIKLMESLGVTNKTIYFDIASGIKMSRYVNGEVLSSLEKYDFKAISDLLHKIHKSKELSKYDYNPFDRLENYQQLLEKSDIDLKYYEIKKEFLTFKDYLDKQEKVLTHGDSQPSNFIRCDNGTILTVDFEFSGNNDPIYDIACFGNNDLKDGLLLLKEYYEFLDDDKLKRFYLWRTYQALQWYLVASFKEKMGMSETLAINFKKIAEEYLMLASETLENAKKIEKK